MAAPTQIVISYISAYTNGIATANTTATLPIASGTDFTTSVLNISRGGGFLFTDSSGVPTWIPVSQVTKIVAQ